MEPYCYIEDGAKIGEGAYIRSHTVICAEARIGRNLTTGNGAIIQGAIVGDDVVIGTHAVIESDAVIGNNVTVHTNAFICAHAVLEDDVWVGPNAVFVNTKYPHTLTSKNERRTTVVKRGARIGANATILPGILIGECALIGAGAVVTKDVPPYSVVVGNPASVIK